LPLRINSISNLAAYLNEKSWAFITQCLEEADISNTVIKEKVSMAEKLFPGYRDAESPHSLVSFVKYIQEESRKRCLSTILSSGAYVDQL